MLVDIAIKHFALCHRFTDGEKAVGVYPVIERIQKRGFCTNCQHDKRRQKAIEESPKIRPAVVRFAGVGRNFGRQGAGLRFFILQRHPNENGAIGEKRQPRKQKRRDNAQEPIRQGPSGRENAERFVGFQCRKQVRAGKRRANSGTKRRKIAVSMAER